MKPIKPNHARKQVAKQATQSIQPNHARKQVAKSDD
jgi:hypothetical protein